MTASAATAGRATPGPATLAKHRLQRMLYAALETSVEELELSRPETSLDSMVRRMVLDAASGRGPAQKQLISLLDKACECEALAEEAAREQTVNEAVPFSLKQGNVQGNEEKCLEDILWPGEAGTESWLLVDDASRGASVHERAAAGSAREQERPQPFSLKQGKMQGDNSVLCAALASPPARQKETTRLMMSSAAVPSGHDIRFGTPPPM
jgi:hypothetical protein